MASLQARVKEIPDKYKLTVSGFIRRMQSYLHSMNDNAFYNIPDLVILAILCFYYKRVGFTNWSRRLEISGEYNHILNNSSDGKAASAFIGYAINSLDNVVIKCKIKITSNGHWSWSVIFGICSDDDHNMNKCLNSNKSRYSYCIQNSGYTDRTDIHKYPVRNRGRWKQIQTWKSGDTLTFILNLPKATIDVEKNDGYIGYAFHDVVRRRVSNTGLV